MPGTTPYRSRPVRCLYCENPLICAHCGKSFLLRSQAEHDSFYEPSAPVRCPHCSRIVRCRYCGATYSGSEDEYEH